MTIPITWLLFGAFALYALASVGNFFSKSKKIEVSLIGFGIIQQAIALFEIYKLTNASPTATIYGLVEVIAFFCAILAIIGLLFKIESLKKLAFVAAVLSILPACCPVFLENVSTEKIATGALIQTHAISAALSYALMLTAFIVSVVYSRKYIALKKAVITKHESSLQMLNKIVIVALFGATFAMLISIIFGIVAINGAQMNALLTTKILGGVCVFLIQAYISTNIILKKTKGLVLVKLTTFLLIISVAVLIAIGFR